MVSNFNLRFSPGQRILILMLALCLFTIIGSAIVAIVVRNGMTTQSLRISTVLQDIIIFMLPALVSAMLISSLPARFLGIDRGFKVSQLLWALLLMFAANPAMNYLVMLNENLVLPDALKGVEEWMRASETRAQESINILLGGSGIGSLVVDILIIGVLAGLSEELFFRGALQNILSATRLNHHAAIWITSFIFSAFHLQFYGFLPRLLMGAYFGYLLVWSRSLWLPILIHIVNNSSVVCAMWHSRGDVATGGETTFNNWGADSPTLILASVVLTVFVLIRLKKSFKSRADVS